MSRFDKYLQRPNAPMPQHHLDILKSDIPIDQSEVLDRKDINLLFDTGYLNTENGYRRNDDGSHYTAVLTPMPNVTIEIIDWWFWWHAAEPVRYQIWYPEMHFDNNADFQGRYDDETLSYRERLHLSTHRVTEDVGMGKGEIIIDFMHPSEFGFDPSKLNDDVTIICARVGMPNEGIWFTDMCHFVRRVGDGVEMRSRFWMGYEIKRIGGFAKPFLNRVLNNSFVKKRMIPAIAGSSMFHHCSQEYHNLAERLPEIYEEEK